REDLGRTTEVDLALIGANLLTLFLLTSEIDAYFNVRGDHTWQSIAGSALLTMGWTVVGTMLVWLGAVRRAFWTQLAGSVVLVMASLLFVQLELIPAPASYVALANPRLIAAVTLVTALYWLSSLAGRQPPSAIGSLVRTGLILAANGMTLLFLTGEIIA